MAQILVVDDEIGIRELLSEILADEGHNVWLADSATAAREQRAREGPALVVLALWHPHAGHHEGGSCHDRDRRRGRPERRDGLPGKADCPAETAGHRQKGAAPGGA